MKEHNKIILIWIAVFCVWSVTTVLFGEIIRQNYITKSAMVSFGMFLMFGSPLVSIWYWRKDKKDGS